MSFLYTKTSVFVHFLTNFHVLPAGMRTDHQPLNDKCNKVGTYAQLFEISRAQSVNTLSPSRHPTYPSLSRSFSYRDKTPIYPSLSFTSTSRCYPDLCPEQKGCTRHIHTHTKKKKAAIYLGPSNQIENLQKEMVILSGWATATVRTVGNA